MSITLFLYLDDVLILAIFYSQVMKDGQRVAQLQERLGFVLSLEKCWLEPTQKFMLLGTGFHHTGHYLTTAQRQGASDKSQVAKMAFSPTCRSLMRLLSLPNLPEWLYHC